MKKLYTTLVALLGIINLAYAQNFVGGPTGNVYYNGGNVGIGTTAPNEFSGGTRKTLQIHGGASTDAILRVTGLSSDFEIGTSPVSGSFFAERTGHDFALFFLGIEHFRFTAGGKLGVGTGNPLFKLNVSQDLSMNADIDVAQFGISGSSDNAKRLVMGYDVNGAGFGFIKAGWYQHQWTNLALQPNGGNVGIGTTTPLAKLDIVGNMQSDKVNANGDDANIILRNAGASSLTSEKRASVWLDNDGKLKLRSVTGNGFAFKDTHNSFDILSINDNGMSIGAALPAGYKLAVNGKIISKEIRVDATWADYVFDNDYKLKTIPEVEAYIKSNHHLPDVPSAAEVEKNGVALGETSSLLLKKIEELTLYLIEKDKQIKQIQDKLDTVTKQLDNNSRPSK